MIRGQYLPCSRPILLLSLLAHLIYQLKTTTQRHINDQYQLQHGQTRLLDTTRHAAQLY